MNENSVVSLRQKDEIDDPLTEILRTGARKLIVQAVEIEFGTFLAMNAGLVLPDGRQRVVRHGHDPVRTIQIRIGPVKVQKPKARDRSAPEAGERIRFTSSILPKWERRPKSPHMGRFGSRDKIQSRMSNLQWLFRHPRSEPDCTIWSFPRQIKLTFGRRSRRLHQYPACGGRGSGRRGHSGKRLFKPCDRAVRPPGSARTDQVLEDLRIC